MVFLGVFLFIIAFCAAVGAIAFIVYLTDDYLGEIAATIASVVLVAALIAGCIATLDHLTDRNKQRSYKVYETQIFECYGTEYRLPSNTDFTCGGKKITGKPLHTD